MSVIFSFVKKHLAHYRKLSLIMAFLYAFSAFFFVTEALAICSYYTSNQKQLDDIFGVHDGVFLCGGDFLPKAEESGVSSFGVISVRALAANDGDFSSRPIVLGTADAEGLELSRIGVAAGRMPQAENEIVLEQTYLNLFYPDAKIGDEIVMQITKPILTENTYKFVLCGVLRDFSSLQWNSEATKKAMPNAVISDKLFKNAPLYSFVNIDFDGEKAELQALADRLTAENKIIAYQPNQRENYDLAALGRSRTAPLIIVAAVMLMLVVAALSVVSALAKRGRAETIGLLKIAGFDVSGILKFYRIKAVMLIAPSVIIGSLIAAAFSGLIVTVKGSDFIIALFCAALIAAIAYLLFTAGVKKESEKSVEENRKRRAFFARDTKTVLYKGENPVFLYALKSCLLNSSGNAAASVMIFFSIITITVTSYFASGMLSNAQGLTNGYDVGVLSGNSSYISLVQVPLEPERGMYKSDYTALKKNGDVDEILGFQRLNVFRLTAEEVPKLYADEEKESFFRAKNMFGYPTELNLDEQRLLGVEDEVLEKLNGYVVDGKIDLRALSSGDEIAVCNSEKTPVEYRAGDVVRIAQVINKNPDDAMISDYYLLDKEVRVGAVVKYPEASAQDKLIRTNLLGYVWSEKAFEKIGLHMNYSNVYLNVAQKENINSLSGLLGQLRAYYKERINITDNLQEATAVKKFCDSFSLFAAMISLGLAVFSLISLMLAVSAKLTNQKKTFGFLRAVGLTRAEMFLIILTENALALGAAVILAAVCGAGLCAMLYKSGAGQIAAVFPTTELILLVLAYSVCIISICAFAIRRFFRQSIIDCIRTNE